MNLSELEHWFREMCDSFLLLIDASIYSIYMCPVCPVNLRFDIRYIYMSMSHHPLSAPSASSLMQWVRIVVFGLSRDIQSAIEALTVWGPSMRILPIDKHRGKGWGGKGHNYRVVTVKWRRMAHSWGTQFNLTTALIVISIRGAIYRTTRSDNDIHT